LGRTPPEPAESERAQAQSEEREAARFRSLLRRQDRCSETGLENEIREANCEQAIDRSHDGNIAALRVRCVAGIRRIDVNKSAIASVRRADKPRYGGHE